MNNGRTYNGLFPKYGEQNEKETESEGERERERARDGCGEREAHITVFRRKSNEHFYDMLFVFDPTNAKGYYATHLKQALAKLGKQRMAFNTHIHVTNECAFNTAAHSHAHCNTPNRCRLKLKLKL